jgi:hypothetical protein
MRLPHYLQTFVLRRSIGRAIRSPWVLRWFLALLIGPLPRLMPCLMPWRRHGNDLAIIHRTTQGHNNDIYPCTGIFKHKDYCSVTNSEHARITFIMQSSKITRLNIVMKENRMVNKNVCLAECVIILHHLHNMYLQINYPRAKKAPAVEL